MEAAPTPEEYQYNPLDPTHPSIRLLEVDAGDGVITCRLTHHALDACPPYSTLSYTWGSTVATHSIVCSGSILRIGANLHDFLTQFQTFPRNRRPLLWVDAICINQSDIPERNDQVLRMRDIYSNAERVLVWLGPEDEDTELVFDEIHGRLIGGLMRFEMKHWHALYSLLSRPYWTRVWIIQELYLS
ncbi:HET-domain-containing protein, partial [Amniculicola lignicola CBS 123094]